MDSSTIFAVLIILVVLVMFYLKYAKDEPEYMVKDYRPHVYLIYSEDPAICNDCDEVVRRFLLSVAKYDMYVARLVEKGSGEDYRLRAQYNVPGSPYPVLIADLPTGPEVTFGSHKIMLRMRDMI